MFKPIFSILAIFCFFGSFDAQAAQHYKVVQGDTLYRIGVKFGIPYKKIMVANGMHKTVIFPNQTLVIPNQTSQTVARKTPITSPRPQVAQSRPVPHYSQPAPIRTVLPASKSYTPPVQYQKPIAIARPVAGINRPIEQHAPQQIPSSERLVARSREVPAVANQSVANSRTFKKLDPIKYPTPSFKKPYNPPKQVYSGIGIGIGNQKRSQPASAPKARTHIVQKGEYVWSIARKYRVNPFALRRVNNIMFSSIRPGMRLMIPK